MACVNVNASSLCVLLCRLEAAARAQEVAEQEASRLERSLVSEREQRLVLEAALKQIQEQMKLGGGAQEVRHQNG